MDEIPKMIVIGRRLKPGKLYCTMRNVYGHVETVTYAGNGCSALHQAIITEPNGPGLRIGTSEMFVFRGKINFTVVMSYTDGCRYPIYFRGLIVGDFGEGPVSCSLADDPNEFVDLIRRIRDLGKKLIDGIFYVISNSGTTRHSV